MKKEKKDKLQNSVEVTSSKKRTLKEKIQYTMRSVVFVSLLVLGIVSSIMNYYSTYSTLKQSLTETSIIASQRISWEIKAYKNIVTEMGQSVQLGGTNYSQEDKQEFIEQRVEEYGFLRGKFIGTDGIAHVDGTDYNDREYFQKAMQGETYFSGPLISKTDGAISLMSAAPVWKDGIANSEIIGVVFVAMPINILNDIVKNVYVSKNSGAYIIDKNGTTVAHTTDGMVESQNNTIENAKTNSGLKKIASLEQKMIAGKDGFGTYYYNKKYEYLAYAPIEDTDGWSIGINAPVLDFMFDTINGIVITIILMIISVIISSKLAKQMGQNIGDAVKQCADRLQLMVDGDLTTPVPEITSDDETKILADATHSIAEGLNAIISDIKYLMASMAKGDFTVESSANERYIGDYEEILISMKGICTSLGETISSIQYTADQVSVGSGQMSEGAQNLAEGVTEQAGAIQQLLSTVQEAASHVDNNAKTARQTSDNARKIGEMARQSIDEIQNMAVAMQRITDASNEIGNISATIKDIADQTNLLSLNASIEAARAGEAGKGFAVVASEINQLSQQSAQAAGETHSLIATAISEVYNGNSIVEMTARSLEKMVNSIGNIVEAVERVADSSEEQATSMNEINAGLHQISSVVEDNSATAQESSTTSERLSEQAIELRKQVEKFKF